MRRDQGTSLYHQVFLVLRDGIASGKYPPGAALPGEQDLCREFGVSRITLRRALASLVEGGLIERRQGRGTFVRRGGPSQPIAVTMSSIMGQFREFTARTRPVVIEFGYGPATPAIHAALGAADERAEFQRAVRIRYDGRTPVLHVTTWVPAQLGRLWNRDDMDRESIIALVARGGVELSSGTQTVSATLADPLLAERLQIAVGSALIRIDRVLNDQNGKPVTHVEVLARPDLFQVRMSLDRADLPG